MSFKNTPSTYGSVTKFFHWSIAILIILQFVWYGIKAYILPEKSELGFFFIRSMHKPLGVIIILLVLMSLVWRVFNTKPLYPAAMAVWEQTIAKVVQIFLYFTMLIMPISGVIMSMAGGYKISLFGLYTLPMLMEKNKALGGLAHEIHEISTTVFIVLLILHLGAALKHHFILKDNLLRRMLPFN